MNMKKSLLFVALIITAMWTTTAYKWTKDMLTVFDEFDIAWTTWCYDADFGFWDQKKHDYKDKPLVDLLVSSEGLEKDK